MTYSGAGAARFFPTHLLCVVLASAACEPSAVQNGSPADSTVAVLMRASVPLVTANMRYGTLAADSMLVLDDATRFVGRGVHLLWSVAGDTIGVRAAEGHLRVGSGAVDLVELHLRTRAGREITARLGRFDGRNSLLFIEGMRVDGRTIEPPLDRVVFRFDSGELTGCGRRCG